MTTRSISCQQGSPGPPDIWARRRALTHVRHDDRPAAIAEVQKVGLHVSDARIGQAAGELN